MRPSRLLVLVTAVTSVGMGVPQRVMAEGKALKRARAEKKALENQVEALDQKVRELERRLEQSVGTAGSARNVVAPAPQAAQVDALDQKVRILERKWELEQEQTVARAKEAPAFTAGKDGFSLKAADDSFRLRIGGYVQADGRFFADDKERALTDTFLLRRVRPILEGTVGKYFDFRIMTDFGGGTAVVQDAYLDAHPWSWARLRVGKYKPPVGLERLQSGAELLFVERGLPTRATSEDVVQETFIGFLNSLPHFDDRRELQTYLFTIASHKLTDHLRRSGRHPLHTASDSAGDVLNQELDHQKGASSLVRSDERRQLEAGAICRGLANIIGQWQERGDYLRLKVLELLMVRGWANRDVASLLKISEQQVANYRFAAVKKLSEQMKEAGLPGDVFPELQG